MGHSVTRLQANETIVSTAAPLPVTLVGGTASATPVVVTGVAYDVSVSIGRPENTTAYTAGDVIGIADAGTPANAGNAIVTFAAIGPSAGNIVVDKVELSIGLSAVPSGMANFRLHFYNASPTAILDNAAFDLTSTDQAKHLGWVDLPTPEDVGSMLKTFAVPMLDLKLAAASTTVYGILETRGGYTPASATIYTIRVSAQQVAA